MRLKLRRISRAGVSVSNRLPMNEPSSQDSKSRACGPALAAFALDNKKLRRPVPVKARPAPSLGGGPVHFSLDGERNGGVPSSKGNATTSGAGGVCAWLGAFSGLAGVLAGSVRGASAERGGCPPRSGRISVTPAACLG